MPEIIRTASDPVNDETCSYCNKDAVIVLQGNANCYYCGNQINLCKAHFDELKHQLDLIFIAPDNET